MSLEKLGFKIISKTNSTMVMQKVDIDSKTNIFFDIDKKTYCVNKEIFTPHDAMNWIPMEGDKNNYNSSKGTWSMEVYVEIPFELHLAIHNEIQILF